MPNYISDLNIEVKFIKPEIADRIVADTATIHAAIVMWHVITATMKTKLTIIILTISIKVFPQTTFEKEFGGKLPDYGKCAIQTNDKGYLMIGESYSFTNGSSDVYIVKTDEKGNKLWARHYGGKNSDYAYDIKQTSDNNYIIVGATDNFGEKETPNVYLLKLDSSGDTLWTKTYGTDFGDYGYSIVESYDKSFIITGMTYDYSKGKQNLLVLKTDKYGNQSWFKNYKLNSSYIGKSIIQTTDNNYIVLADKPEYGGQIIDSHLRLFKINQLGDTLWTKIIKNKYSFQAGNIIQTQDKGFVIMGTSVGDSSNKLGATDIYLIKTNDNGYIEWMKNYGEKDYDFGHNVIQTSDLNYVLVGETYRNENYNNYKDLVLYKVDNKGEVIWTRKFKSKGIKLGSSLYETSDSGLLIGGTLNNNDGINVDEMFLLKVDKMGNLTNE